VSRVFEFGPFRLDERERSLETGGGRIPLTPKAFQTLIVLVENSGKLVEKSVLLANVWNNVHVDEAVLTRAISDLRKTLDGEGESLIETVPKFGYRFVAPVAVSQGTAARPAPEVSRKGRGLWKWAAAVVLLLSTAWMVDALRPRLEAPPPVLHLAVLPFQPIGSSAANDSLGPGIADAVIMRLSNLQALIVRPMSTVWRYRGAQADALAAGRDLEVDAVLEGSVQSAGGSVRVYARLIQAKDGKALWADTVESNESRLFALQDSLAQQVASHLAIRLSAEEQRELASNQELNPEAHRLYVRGRYELGKRTREGFEAAADAFRQAIDLDPAYARAYAGLADCYFLLGGYSWQPQLETLPQAKAMALRALQLNPHLADAHATLALVKQNLDWDWAGVEQEYREAIRLAPNNPTAHHWYAEFLSIQGRFEESAAEFAHAREIDPISLIIPVDEAQLYFFARNYDRSLELLREVARKDPSFALAHERMAWAYMVQGREEDAWAEVRRLPECSSENSVCRLTWTAWLARRDPVAARNALAKLATDVQARHVPMAALVVGYARQGQSERALDWFENMEREHAVWLITAKVNPIFDQLRQYPRMHSVLRRLRLE
jgi:TolB-like protein/DNA-binding winged helix-turn-helix (wHTH) protein/Tfp pilus assembly protein PilF